MLPRDAEQTLPVVEQARDAHLVAVGWQQLVERAAPLVERPVAERLAVELEQVERVQHARPSALLEQREARPSGGVERTQLAVDHRLAVAERLGQRGRDLRVALGDVDASPAPQPRAASRDARDDPDPVPLDLEDPVVARRERLRRAREHRLRHRDRERVGAPGMRRLARHAPAGQLFLVEARRARGFAAGLSPFALGLLVPVARPFAAARLASSAASRSAGASLRRSGFGTSTDSPAALASIICEQPIAVRVAVLLRVPLRDERGHELACDVQLLLADLGLGALDLVLGRDLVCVEQRGQREAVTDGPDAHQLLLRTEHDAADADQLLLGERALEQRERPRGGIAIGPEPVGALELDRVDLVLVHELLELDRVARLGLHRLELLVGQRHVAALGDLVALHDLVRGHFLVLDLADPSLADARAVRRVQLVEPHVAAPRRRVEPHRDVDQPEADGTGPRRARHAAPYPRPRRVKLA